MGAQGNKESTTGADSTIIDDLDFTPDCWRKRLRASRVMRKLDVYAMIVAVLCRDDETEDYAGMTSTRG